MDGFAPSTYGDAFADVYDRWYGDLPGLEETIGAVERLAEGGPVLELGCGTGRLAIPLAARRVGVVHGLDSSAAMLVRLRAKAGGEAVVTHEADMSEFALAGAPPFSVVFLAFNSLYNVPSAAGQAGCFASVARHLAPGGRFALECAVPGDPPSQVKDAVELHSLDAHRVVLRVSRQDPQAQTVLGQHVEISEAGIRMRPWLLRYVTIDELDAMAAAVGLVLESRWADWSGTEFGPDAINHVSVYRRSG